MRQRHVIALAVVTAIVLFALDTALAVTLTGTFTLVPLVAALARGAAVPLAAGALALALAVVAGALDGMLPTLEHNLRLGAVAVGTALAAGVGHLRVRTARAMAATRAAEAALGRQSAFNEALLSALDEVGGALVVLEGQRVVYANDAFARLTGRSRSELEQLGSIFEVVAPEARADVQRRARLRVQRGLIDRGYVVDVVRPDGERVAVEVGGVPARRDGGTQLIVVARDVTARRRMEDERERLLALERRLRAAAQAAERRAGFLAEASAVFDASLDEAETLENVARLVARRLADACVIAQLGPAGGAWVVAVAAGDPQRERRLRAGADHAEGAPAPLDPLLLRVLDDAGPAEAGLDGDEDPGLRELGLRAALAVPLTARGRVLGAMALGFAAPPDDALGDLRPLVEDVGQRAALALDNARLYSERSHVARTLQRSLLPPRLPDVAGLELAARYHAAGEGIEAGGDFYDCFPIHDRSWVVAVGDVCGKGPEAASLTALARHTLRACGLHTADPQTLLAELNGALLAARLDFRFCTVACAALRPAAGGVRGELVLAGHPPPLLLDTAGGVRRLGEPGMLLGIAPDPELPVTPFELAPGEALVIYTDGVIEARRDARAGGDAELAALLARCAGRDAEAIAQAVADSVLDSTGTAALADDVAVLVLRAPPLPARGEADAASAERIRSAP